MKKIKFLSLSIAVLFIHLIIAQNKTVSIKEKDIIGETKISPIVPQTAVKPSKLIICAPSKSAFFRPLYVLDGKIIDNEQFSKINGNKIESVKVIRGGEAKAIYGDKGINGVIILTSKK